MCDFVGYTASNIVHMSGDVPPTMNAHMALLQCVWSADSTYKDAV